MDDFVSYDGGFKKAADKLKLSFKASFDAITAQTIKDAYNSLKHGSAYAVAGVTESTSLGPWVAPEPTEEWVTATYKGKSHPFPPVFPEVDKLLPNQVVPYFHYGKVKCGSCGAECQAEKWDDESLSILCKSCQTVWDFWYDGGGNGHARTWSTSESGQTKVLFGAGSLLVGSEPQFVYGKPFWTTIPSDYKFTFNYKFGYHTTEKEKFVILDDVNDPIKDEGEQAAE